jgi:hypothetical protein
LTPNKARRVGLELGGLLLVAAGLLGWRGGRVAAATAAALLGLALCSTALARPTLLVPFARRWMGLASVISRVTSPIVLGAIYLVLITPMAWMRRSFGHSPIARDRAATTYWRRREPLSPDAARRGMERQF